MNKLLIIVFGFTISITVFAQNKNYTQHTVAAGETIYQLSKKYNIDIEAIYTLNPEARNGIKVDMVLVLPNSKSTFAPSTNIAVGKNQHEVQEKETIYGIAKQYKLKVDELVNLNPILETEGLKIGQIITIAASKNMAVVKPKVFSKSDELVNYEVLPKETLYSLSKKFLMTMENIVQLNPELENGVKIAMIIKIPSSKIGKNTIKPIKMPNKAGTSTNNNDDDVPIEIISKKPTFVKIEIPTEIQSKAVVNLSRSLRKDVNKKLFLLLPFNVTRIQNDTVVSQQERLKKDAFLNMTLDFYSGALMAIDSAKTLNLNIDVTILDSQETKNSSNIENLAAQNNLQNADAIIGPFYQSQVDKLAGLLERNNIPVISPLSKEAGKPFRNSFVSMPTNDLLKNAMFDYMKSKNGNIIAVIDNKKESIKNYITINQPETKFAIYTDKGTLSTESIKALLVKDKVNYVVFASERTGTIFSVTNTLINALSNYQIRLVILEPNPTFDYEEIALSRLTRLKLTYPSLRKENETNEAMIFEKKFKRKNKIFPNQYATRGFDITFDTMLRLAQANNFEATTTEIISEQVETKFDYVAKPNGGYINKGAYILQYNSDLTISIAD